MPQGTIGFGAQQSGDDAFADAPPVAINVLFDGKGVLRRRPGIRAYAYAPSAAISSNSIIGVHRTVDGQLFAVDNEPGHRRIYRVTAGAGLDISTPIDADLRGTSRPVFAETEGLLLIAGGKEPQKISKLIAGTPSARLGGSPPNASHIISIASRLLANRVETPLNEVHFSASGDGASVPNHEDWTNALRTGVVRATGRPDSVVALHETLNEVWLFGSLSMQIMVPDPSLFFAPANQYDIGIIAPYTAVRIDDKYAWMDDKKRFVVGNGRSAEPVSKDIQRSLDGMTTVSDGWGFRFSGDQFEAAIWPFDTDGRAWCRQAGGGWSTWQSWDGSSWGKINITSAFLDPSSKATIVGTRDGKVAELSTSATDDLGDTIRVLCQSGYKSWGTDSRKTSNCVTLTFERPNYDSSTAIQVRYRYRNEDGGWKQPILLDLDAKQKVIRLRSMGVYRRRQHEIDYEAAEDVVLTSAVEEYTVQED